MLDGRTAELYNRLAVPIYKIYNIAIYLKSVLKVKIDVAVY